MPLSLYVHIPFCLKRCIYCDFVSGIYDPEKESAYITALKKEILNIQDKTPFTSLYIGGGTPTALSTPALSNLITHIFNRLCFNEGYEATIEANPGTIDIGKLHAIHSSGINRLSIGVQSFNDDELDCLGRLHSSGDAEQAVYLAKDAGFENIGIDLIYGIPGQNIVSWRKTLQKAVSLKPEHISAYELTVEQGTLLYDYMNNPPSLLFRKGGEGEFVEEETIIEMYSYAIDYLGAEGFIHYEISNFAMPDYFCRHNLNYWDRGNYYGAGLGAHSFIKEKRFCNTDSLEDYMKAIPENKSPVKKTWDITEDKALSEAIFLGLRKRKGINLKTFSELYRKDILTLYQKEIKELQEAGLIEINGSSRSNRNYGTDNYIRLTGKGLLLSNEVFVKFM